MLSDSKRKGYFFDRIHRIIWMLRLPSPLPDEGEKTQSRLYIGGKNSGLTVFIAWLRILWRYLSPCLRMALPSERDYGFCLSSGKAKNLLYPANPVSQKRYAFVRDYLCRYI
jgi:hypothetical protein